MYKPKKGDKVAWLGERGATGEPSNPDKARGVVKRQHDKVKDAWEIEWENGQCMYTYEKYLELAGPIVTTESY